VVDMVVWYGGRVVNQVVDHVVCNGGMVSW